MDFSGALNAQALNEAPINGTENLFDDAGSVTQALASTLAAAELAAAQSGGGLTARDLAGSNDGTLRNGPTWVTDRITPSMRGALSFDGTDSEYVSIPDDVKSLIDGSEEATIELWCKVPNNEASDAITDTGIFALEGSSSNNTHYPYNDGLLYLSTFRDARVNGIDDGGFDKTKWHHLAITTQPGTDGWKLYQNGSLVIAVDGEDSVKVEDDISLGFNQATHYWTGEMGNVRIWDYARTQQQIQDNKDKRLTGTESGLVGYWPLDDLVAAETAGVCSSLVSAEYSATLSTAGVTILTGQYLTAEELAAALSAALETVTTGENLLTSDLAAALAEALASIGAIQTLTVEELTAALSAALASAGVGQVLSVAEFTAALSEVLETLAQGEILTIGWFSAALTEALTTSGGGEPLTVDAFTEVFAGGEILAIRFWSLSEQGGITGTYPAGLSLDGAYPASGESRQSFEEPDGERRFGTYTH